MSTVNELGMYPERKRNTVAQSPALQPRSERPSSYPRSDGLPSRRGGPSITMAQRAVLHLLKHVGPSTDADLVSLYPSVQRMLDRGDRYPAQTPSGIRTRRNELVLKGYVFGTDKVRNANGRLVWIWSA